MFNQSAAFQKRICSRHINPFENHFESILNTIPSRDIVYHIGQVGQRQHEAINRWTKRRSVAINRSPSCHQSC